MWSKIVLKLLRYPGVHSCHCYQFEGEDVVRYHTLPCDFTELAGISPMWSYHLPRPRTYAANFMVFSGSEDSKMVNRLFVSGARYYLLVAMMASTLGTNFILKC